MTQAFAGPKNEQSGDIVIYCNFRAGQGVSSNRISRGIPYIEQFFTKVEVNSGDNYRAVKQRCNISHFHRHCGA